MGAGGPTCPQAPSALGYGAGQHHFTQQSKYTSSFSNIKRKPKQFIEKEDSYRLELIEPAHCKLQQTEEETC